MNQRPKTLRLTRTVLRLSVCLAALCAAASAEPKLSGIQARHVRGQTFLMWREVGLTAEMRVAVFVHSEAITAGNLEKARLLSPDLMPGSSCDFYDLQDKNHARYKPLPEGASGAVVPWGEKFDAETGHVTPGRIEPYHGLYVRTADRAGKASYAVIVRDLEDENLTGLEVGESSLAEPVEENPADSFRPILTIGRPFKPVSGVKRTHLNVIFGGDGPSPASAKLTKKGIPLQHYVFYGSSDQGWREGLPCHFTVEEVHGDAPLFYKLRFDESEFSFMGAPRGNCFFGVNSNIVRPEKMAEGTVAPHSHRVVLTVLPWVKANYPIDPDLVWLSASSIQGNGGFMFLLRHPGPICAADVATVAPDMKLMLPFKQNAAVLWGPVDTVKTSEGLTVSETLYVTDYLKKHSALLPPIRLANGRKDGWRPWQMCPPFYKLLLEQGQPCWIFWNNRGHGNRSRRKLFAEVFGQNLWETFPRNRAFLGFTNGTANDDPGNGDREDGDLEGTLNSFYRWGKVADTEEKFSAEYWYERDGKTDGGTVDVIAQRLQHFPHGKDAKANYRILDGGKAVKEGNLSADRFGRFWIKGAPADKRYLVELTR